MNKAEIERKFAETAMAKVSKANALGSKTSWTMEDHSAAAIECLVAIGGNREQIEAAWPVLYNQSAMAQKLEKAFEGTGHFARTSRKEKVASEFAQYIAKMQSEQKGGNS